MATKVNAHVVIEKDEPHLEVINSETGEIELKMKIEDLVNGFECGWQVAFDMENEKNTKSDSEK